MKARGRPPLDGQGRSVQVSFSLPAKRLEELHTAARAQRVTLADLLRRLVTKPPRR